MKTQDTTKDTKNNTPIVEMPKLEVMNGTQVPPTDSTTEMFNADHQKTAQAKLTIIVNDCKKLITDWHNKRREIAYKLFELSEMFYQANHYRPSRAELRDLLGMNHSVEGIGQMLNTAKHFPMAMTEDKPFGFYEVARETSRGKIDVNKLAKIVKNAASA